MTKLKLYDYPISGNCYKIRLLLSMLGCNYERIAVDILKDDTHTAEFLQLNPRGQIPVLNDGGTVIWDSMAILVYLARRYGSEQWLSVDPLGEASVMQWLAVAENELLYGLARARAVKRLKRPFDLAQCQKEGYGGLSVMELRLGESNWLAASHVTIADIACYPYVAVCHEGDVSLEAYPAVRDWLNRVEGLPGWIAMGS